MVAENLSLIERFEKMRRRVLANFAADSSTYLSTVAKVHSSPHTGVTFLGMNLVDARIIANCAIQAFEL
jgi:hypothetical protein